MPDANTLQIKILVDSAALSSGMSAASAVVTSASQQMAAALAETAPAAVKMGSSLKQAGMSAADASSALKNLGFSAKETSAALMQAGYEVQQVGGKTKELKLFTDDTTGSLNRMDNAMAMATARMAGMTSGLGFAGAAMGRVAAASSTLGPLLALAFPVFAAVALLDVLGLMFDKLDELAVQPDKVRIAFTELWIAMEKSLDSARDKIDKLHEKFLTLTQGPLAGMRFELEHIRLNFDNVESAATHAFTSIAKGLKEADMSRFNPVGWLAWLRGVDVGVKDLTPLADKINLSLQEALLSKDPAKIQAALMSGITELARVQQKTETDAFLAEANHNSVLTERYQQRMLAIRSMIAALQDMKSLEKSDETTTKDEGDLKKAQIAKEREKEAEKAAREYERLEKEKELATHRRIIAELNDQEVLAKEQLKIEEQSAEITKEFNRNIAEEEKKIDEEILRNKQKALTQAIEAQSKFLREQARLAKEAERPWIQLGHSITAGMDSTIRGVLQGTQTLGQAFSRLGSDMLISMAESLAKIYLKHLAHWAAVNVLEKISLTQSIGTAIAGATAKKAVEATAAIGSISSDAGIAGAAGFASVMQALPFPANVAVAPGVMAAAIATTLGNLTLASAAGGWDVPGSLSARGALTMVHPSEMILPSHLANAVRSGAGGGSSAGGDTHIHLSYSPQIHAIDARGVAGLLDKHSSDIVAAIRKEQREFKI
jgi:hypothetical protein